MIEELRGGERQPLIVQELPEAKPFMWEVGSRVIEKFLGAENNGAFNVENKKKGNKVEAYNIYNVDDLDGKNCYGWSVTVTKKQSDMFKHTDFGVFMVNLTKVNSYLKLVLCRKILVSYVCFKVFIMFYG